MEFPQEGIAASSENPFDKSYNYLQRSFDTEIIKLLCSIMKLNLTLIKTPLITDLRAYETNADDWIIEQIVNGSAEISSTTLILTNETQDSCHYSFGVGTYRPQLYYKARTLRDDNDLYFAAYSKKVIIAISVVFVLVVLALAFVTSVEAKLPHKISYDVFARIIDIQEDRDEEWSEDLPNTSEEWIRQKEKWDMGEIVLVCLGALCQQGSSRDPSTNAARLLLLLLFLLAVICNTGFAATIISFISSFPSIEREHSLQVRRDFSEDYNLLLHDTVKIGTDLKLNFSSVKGTGLKNGFEKAMNGEALFVGDRDVSLTFFHKQNYGTNLKCQLGRAYLGLEYHRVFAMKKNYKHKEKINYNVLRLKELGFLEREKKRIFNNKSPCTLLEKSTFSNFVSFNVSDIWPGLRLWIVGILASILFLLIENLFHKYC